MGNKAGGGQGSLATADALQMTANLSDVLTYSPKPASDHMHPTGWQTGQGQGHAPGTSLAQGWQGCDVPCSADTTATSRTHGRHG